jgi:diacylglycerol kinase (ATP)
MVKPVLPSKPVPIIYNPASGGGRGRARFKEASEMFAERNIELDPVETEHPGHATDLARDLSAVGNPFIYVMGGDGTLSEASEGILTSGRSPTLGFIPAGTGNDFLRDHGFTDRAHAIDRITMGQPKAIDAATLRYEQEGEEHLRHWINIFGTGFAAQAGASAAHYKWAKSQAYNLGVVEQIIGLKPTRTKLTIDGEERIGNYPMVMVCNSIHTGGAMKMAPMADTTDGLLDVLTIEGVGRIELLGLLGKVRDGAHVRHKAVNFERAKEVRIEPDRPSPLLVDGEVLGRTPVDVRVLPGALRVLL